MDGELCKAVHRNPRKMGDVWCFAGTRMPVASLFEHLAEGSTVDEFLKSFSGLPTELVRSESQKLIGFPSES